MKKKILVTGGNGFIGKNIIELINGKYHIYSPSRKQLDLLDDTLMQRFLRTNRFDVVIHAAITVSNATLVQDQKLIFQNDLRMFANLYRSRNLFGRMFYFGSGAEYDKKHIPPKVSEDFFDVFLPSDEYGFSKYICNKLAGCSDNIYNLRLFGCFGKYENWKMRFISNAICKAVYNSDITLKQNVYFDYLYINDLVRILEWFIDSESLKHASYNVCTGKTIDLITIANKIVDYSQKRISIKFKKKGLKREYSGNNQRLLKEMKTFKFTPIDKAIGELFDWYKKNRKRIDSKSLYEFG